MKKALLFIAAAAMFVLAGCQKAPVSQEQQQKKDNDVIHISVGQIAPGTKVAANDITAETLTFKWDQGDAVAFWDMNFQKVKTYTCTDPEKGTFQSTEGAVLDPSKSYFVIHPADFDFNAYISPDEILPYHSTYRGNQIPVKHCIMAVGVQGNATSFTLDQHITVIHFKLKGNAIIGSIEYQTAGNTSSVLNCGEGGVQLNDATPTDFYVDAIYAAHDGFKLVIKDCLGDAICEKSSNMDLTNIANSGGAMVDFDEPITVNASSEPEYVEMKMGTGEGAYTLKWATMNLGATTVAGSYTTCYGDLYQWGSVNTLYDGFPYTSATAGSFTWKTGKTSGFVSTNREYKGNDDLSDATNDVVKKNYPGTNWRMPTKQEFQDLYEACVGTDGYDKTTKPTTGKPTSNGVYWCDSYDGVAGVLFYDGTNVLFFPAAGFGSETDLWDAGASGNYWSSSPSYNGVDAYYLYFDSSEADTLNDDRSLGSSVRPVSD